MKLVVASKSVEEQPMPHRAVHNANTASSSINEVASLRPYEVVHSTAPGYPDACLFLRTLGINHQFLLLKGHDGKKKQAKHFYGTVEEHLDEVLALNADGWEAYVTVNDTNGKGRRRSIDITAVRGIPFDMDEGLVDLPVAPTLLIETSPNRFQAIIGCGGMDLLTYDGVMQGVRQTYEKVDRQATDRARVFRIPGTINWKRGGVQTRLLRERSTFMRVPVATIIKEFPVVEVPKKERSGSWRRRVDALNAETVVDALNLVARAISATGSTSFEVKQKNGEAWLVDVYGTKPWKKIVRAALDCTGDRFLVRAALDDLSRLSRCPEELQKIVRRVYHEGRNAEIMGGVLDPEDYADEAEAAPISSATLLAMKKAAEKLLGLGVSRRKHAASNAVASAVRRGLWSPKEVYSSAAITIDRVSQEGDYREFLKLINDAILAAGGERYVLTRGTRDKLCDRFGIRRDLLAKWVTKAKAVFAVVPGRHSDDYSTYFGWTSPTKEALDLLKYFQGQVESAAGVDHRSVTDDRSIEAATVSVKARGNTLSVGDYSGTHGEVSNLQEQEPACETYPRRCEPALIQVAEAPNLAVTMDQLKAPIRFERHEMESLVHVWSKSDADADFWPLTIERGVLPFQVEQALLAIPFADKSKKRYLDGYAKDSGMLLEWVLDAACISWLKVEQADGDVFAVSESCRVLMQFLARAVGKWRYRMASRQVVEGDHRATLEAWVFALGRTCFEYGIRTPHHARHQKVADHKARNGLKMPKPIGYRFATCDATTDIEPIVVTEDEAAFIREQAWKDTSGPSNEKLHITAGNEVIAICEMTTPHLRNSLKSLSNWQMSEQDSFRRRELRSMGKAFEAELARRGVMAKKRPEPEIDFAALWGVSGKGAKMKANGRSVRN